MSTPLRALIIEDSEGDALLIVRELCRSGYDLTFERVDTPESFATALARQAWDIVIADYRLPSFSGLDALQLLKESSLDLPFIIVSGAIGEDIVVTAMKAGAHDYVMKDNLARLGPAAQRELQEAEVRRARREAEEALRLRAEQLNALSRASQAVTASLELDQVLAEIVSLASEVVATDYTSVVLVDEASGIGQAAENLPGVPGLKHRFRENGLTQWVVRSRRTVLIDEISEDGTISPKLGDGPSCLANPFLVEAGIKSLAALPLMVKDQLLGVLYLHSLRTGAFHGQLSLLTAFANQVAIAIENARLFEEAHLRADELATALAKLEEMDLLKAHFIQNISHELRSPLALIRGYADMLVSGGLGELEPEQENPVAVIARRARMLSELVEDATLLLEAEVSPPEAEPVSMGELVQAAAEDFRVAAGQAGLTLHTDIAPDLPPASCSHIYLLRVLDNLLSNAIKFTHQGGTISVKTWQAGDEIALQVSDTGIGIPPDELERIFGRFYQVDGSTSRQYGGVGLGLALVKEISEAYGGRVSVESQAGEGSTFTILIPVYDDVADA